MRNHPNVLLAMAVMLFVVGLTGIVLMRAPDTPTGHVVAENACLQCEGEPVCAVLDGSARNYENACAARCDGARVLAEGLCERIARP